jgi:hypothetical protein
VVVQCVAVLIYCMIISHIFDIYTVYDMIYIPLRVNDRYNGQLAHKFF